jgi:hypothetical protein
MIIVELTSVEAFALKRAGDAADREIESLLLLSMTAHGVELAVAVANAKEMAQAALSARRKIAEATRYEIKVVD